MRFQVIWVHGCSELSLWESVVVSLCQKLKDMHCYVLFDNFFTSPKLLFRLSEMECGEHDWLPVNSFLVIKWKNDKSVMLLTNYFNSKATQQIDRRMKGSKEKVSVLCPSFVNKYNQFMGGIDLCDQIKVTNEVDHRSKFRFYSQMLLDSLDIAIVNSKILYHKTDSTPPLSTIDFRYSITQKTISNFLSRKKAISTSRPMTQWTGESFGIVDHLPDFNTFQARCAYVQDKKLKKIRMFPVSDETCLCAFKNNRIASTTFIQNKTFHL